MASVELSDPQLAQAALLTFCPTCNAGEMNDAEPCWSDTGQEAVPVHRSRMDQARKEIEGALEQYDELAFEPPA